MTDKAVVIKKGDKESHFEKSCNPLLVVAKSFEITSDEHLELARDNIRDIKGIKKEIEEYFNPDIDRAHKLHKSLLSKKNSFIEPLAAAEKVYKDDKISPYLDLKEKEEEKERLRLAEVARKERDTLLNRAAKKIDKLLERTGDLQAQVISLEEALQNPEMTEEEEETIHARLRPLYAKIEGAKEQIEDKTAEIEDHSVVPEPMSAPTSSPKTKGMSARKKLEATVVNPMALVKAIASGQAPIGIIKWDIGQINKIVNTGMRLPGTNTTTKRVVGVR